MVGVGVGVDVVVCYYYYYSDSELRKWRRRHDHDRVQLLYHVAREDKSQIACMHGIIKLLNYY